VPATLTGSGYLRSDAARQYTALNSAFQARFGADLVITEGYRSYERQKYLYDGWLNGQPGFNYAAEPGTSNHGWATACDFGAGVASYGTPQKAWMDANAPTFGWSPTGNGFPSREPWHFDYIRAYEPITAPPTDTKEEDMDKLYIITQGTTSRWAPGSKFLISNGRSRLVSTADLALVGLALSDGIEVTTSEMGRVLALHSIPDSGSVSINDFDRYRNISLALNADSPTPNIQYTVSSNLEAVKSGVGAIRTKVGA